MLPELETVVIPAITDGMAPPATAPPEYRLVGPWLEHHEHTPTGGAALAEDMADLAALVRRYLAPQRRRTAGEQQ